jgi:hypothetical protein
MSDRDDGDRTKRVSTRVFNRTVCEPKHHQALCGTIAHELPVVPVPRAMSGMMIVAPALGVNSLRA